MSSRNSKRRRLRQKLDKKLYEYVVEKNKLPSSIRLMVYADVEYMQARKFIKKKKENDEWDIAKILASGGKTFQTTKPKSEVETKSDEDAHASTGNLLTDSVIEATKEAIKEAQKKAEEATPSQEAEVGPVSVIINSSDDEAVSQDEKEEKQAQKHIVTRHALRSMSADAQNRFFDAVDTMLIAKSGAGSSEFYRLASYHGMPRPIYCQHGVETFPGWHRIYLFEFERALQAADKENGHDGGIGLPYWDWMSNVEEGLPGVIRRRFKQWPKDLMPKGLVARYPLMRDTDENIADKIRSWGTARSAYDCLLATQHWAHASTGGGQPLYPSVEHSHNHMHVIIGGNGGTMSSVAWAAYDIAFWLHHCNVDRIYESYLQIEPDSATEFEATQEGRSRDLFDLPYTPFKKENGEYYFPSDQFDTEKIGYKYDALIQAPAMQLREAPTLVLFRQVKVYQFESKCYQIHVYVVDKDKENEFKEPARSGDIDVKAVNYAGGEAIFGRGMECSNCMTRPPVDLFVDITQTLRDLNLSRYNASIHVYVEETTDNSDRVLLLSDTPLPQPIITGPFFESLNTETLDPNGAIGGANNKNEVMSLQRFLTRFGYYDDDCKIDGEYGPITVQAVKDYQQASNLKVDGIAGPETKKSIVTSRRCSNKDPFAQNKAIDSAIMEHKYAKNEVTYFIEGSPGYLQREKVEDTIAQAFKQWEISCGLSFRFLDDDVDGNEQKADIVLRWTEDDGNKLGFDGAGGILGHGGHGFVDFDRSERWVYGVSEDEQKELSVLSDVSTWYRGQPTVSLFYVAVHEIGHALGLDHSMDSQDVMGPYYTPGIMVLSKNDVSRIQALYP